MKYVEKGLNSTERGEVIRKLMCDPALLALDSVEVCTDFTKSEVTQKFDDLQTMADGFNSEK